MAAVFSIDRDHVLFDDLFYLIPILNSIEEEDEYRQERSERTKHPVYTIAEELIDPSDSTYGMFCLNSSDSLAKAIKVVDEMQAMLASPTKIVNGY